MPNGLHGEWTRKALQAGKHVLCEKPLTPTADEARDLFALAEDKSLLLMEAFMYRHHPQTEMAARSDPGGRNRRAVSRPVLVSLRGRGSGERRAVQRRAVGGALRDVGCYCVSFSNYLLEAGPTRVSAVAHLAESGVDQRFSASMAYENGALATFDCSIQAPLHIGLTVFGSRGACTFLLPGIRMSRLSGSPCTAATQLSRLSAEGDDSYFLEIENFSAAVAGDAEPEVAPEETVRNLQTIDRLIAAAASDG